MKILSIKKLLSVLFVCYSLVPFYAQNSGNIITKIAEKLSQPVEFSTNVLYKSKDSTIVKIAMSEPDGSVIFEGIDFGKYYIHTSFVGLKERYTQVVHRLQKTQIPTIKLQPDTVLDEVVVNSRRNLIKKEIDRVVLNVKATMTDGGNLAEVLQLAPGINIRTNGAVSLRGKSGVMVLIDGRRSYLKGTDLENFLNGMSANQFSKIEIMTNAPAKYEAEGNAGIINIVTKRNYQKGWELNIGSSYRQGVYAEIGQSLGIKVNAKKISFFSNVSYTNKKDFEEFDITRRFSDSNKNLLSTYDQNTFMRNENNLLTARLGLDYFINEKTSLGVIISPQVTIGETNVKNQTLLTDNLGILETKLIAPAFNEADNENFQSNIHASNKLDSDGQNISIDLDYLQFNSKAKQTFQNRYFNASNNLTQEENLINKLPQKINIYTGKIDYTLPLGEDIKLEIGGKMSFVNTNNDAQFFEQIGGGQLVLDTTLSNFFKYKENVNAGYLNYMQSFGDISFQVGVRAENTDVEGDQVTQNIISTNNYTNILPSAFLKYELGEDDEIGFSYGKRLERPDYTDLNPFRYFFDALTFEEGNPTLNPELSDNYELSYATLGGAITATGYFNKVEDIITDVIFQNENTNETFIRKENLSNLTTYGVNLSVSMPIMDDWIISSNLDYSQNKLLGNLSNKEFTIKANTFAGFLMNQYKIDENWGFQLAGWYTSKSLSDTFIQEPYGRISFGISRKLWGGKGKIRLSGNDIFGWTNFNARSGFPNTDVSVENTWQTKTLKLAFTYKINSGNNKKIEERETGIEQESERLKSYKN